MEADMHQSSAERYYRRRWLSVVFTSPVAQGREAEKITQLLRRCHVDYLHLRKPQASASELRELLAQVPSDLHPQIRLHDHFELLGEFPALAGVQLNSRNPEAPAQATTVTAGAHSLEELSERFGARPGYEYITLSPIFSSLSKPGYESQFPNPEALAASLKGGKVVALGGCTPLEFARLQSCGFAGAAVLGYLWESEEKFAERAARLAAANTLMRSLPLMLVTNASTVETTVAQALEALKGGCSWVQVRMKDAATEQRVQAAQTIMQRHPAATVLIDDDVEAVRLSGAAGVHLGKTDMPTEQARSILGPQTIIGRTCNTLADVEQFATPEVDYLGVGPFRHTLTKKNLAPILGVEGYRGLLEAMKERGIHTPIVAIGGIVEQDVKELIPLGVAGIAVSGTITSAPSPSEATGRLFAALRSAGI